MKKELRIDAAAICWALCPASFGSHQWLFYQYFSIRPSSPQPDLGFVHALNNHGTYVYISDVESTGMALLLCVFFIGFVLGAAIIPNTLVPFPPSTPRWLTYLSFSFKTELAEPRRQYLLMAVSIVLYLAIIIFAGPSMAQFAVSHGVIMSAGKTFASGSSEIPPLLR